MQQLQGWGGAARQGSWPGCPLAKKAPHSCPQAGLPPKLLLHQGSVHSWTLATHLGTRGHGSQGRDGGGGEGGTRLRQPLPFHSDGPPSPLTK